MAAESVHEFTDANFQDEVLNSDQPVLVDFWAEWCMPCKMLGPTIDQVASDFEGKAKVGKVNIDDNKKYATDYGVSAIPTVLIFKNGEIAKQFVGIASKEDLADALEAAAG